MDTFDGVGTNYSILCWKIAGKSEKISQRRAAVVAGQQRRDRPAVGQRHRHRSVGQRRQLEARAQHDCWDRLEAVSCPTLVCGGLYDGLARPEAQRALRDRISGARLEMFEGGHLFLQQDVSALPAIEAFLRSCDPSGGAA